ncbi:OB-fold nucleic acid binding domain-containing protein [Quadrisphaera sp. DSM 44207]|uniref:OB-fold nucleic acid binding domain-containing protein n=1 Tax=Quadrisphaera sp. DSM 44207 TaxID=1881057 RepID=UPI0008831CE8|nr:OB-fold nucleic acid binding domain-containing protein [Quadrisphaera sp. DSM 44207]SDQ50124.1 ATP-dependent DNA helicase RecG [Quadrisphaera sp. DSM 44207]
MHATVGTGARLRAALSRWTAGRAELEAQDAQERAARMGGTPCAQLTGRQQANVSGTLRTVTLRPRAGVPALEAELFDGTGTLSVIWLGRREIPGIVPGQAVRVEGFVGCTDGRKVVYNPRYEIVPGAGR